MNNKIIVTCVGAAFFAVSAAYAAPLAKPMGYAEMIYSEYAASSSDKVSFDISVMEKGALKQRASVHFSKIIGTPSYQITSGGDGINTSNHVFANVDSRTMKFPDLEASSADFAKAGYPLEGAKYRVFDVAVTIGSDVRHHRSMEFCWAAQDHCVMLDPSIEFLDSAVNNRIRLKAEGAGAKIAYEAPVASAAMDKITGTVTTLAGVCGLSSNHASKSRTSTWSSRTVTYKNLFGMIMVQKTLGGQQAGLSCNTSCQPSPFGYGNASSAWANPGYTVACDAKFGYGTTGSSGKFDAESKCTHQALGSASASGSVSGQGSASVSIAWSLNGGVDSIGGATLDSCGYF